MKFFIFIFIIFVFNQCMGSTSKNMTRDEYIAEKERIKFDIGDEILVQSKKYIYKGIYINNTVHKKARKITGLRLDKGYEKTDKTTLKKEKIDKEKEKKIKLKDILSLEKAAYHKLHKDKIEQIKLLNTELHLPLVLKDIVTNKLYDIHDEANGTRVLKNTLIEKFATDFIVFMDIEQNAPYFRLCGQNFDMDVKTTILDGILKNRSNLLINGYLENVLNRKKDIRIFADCVYSFLRYDKDTIIKVLKYILNTQFLKIDRPIYFNLLSYFTILAHSNPDIDWKIMYYFANDINIIHTLEKSIPMHYSKQSKKNYCNFVEISCEDIVDHYFNTCFTFDKNTEFNFEPINPKELISVQIIDKVNSNK